MRIRDRIATTMKCMMEENHMTVKELADTMYISKSSVQEYLKGRRSMGIDTLELLAHRLNVPVEYLVSGKTSAPPSNYSIMELLASEVQAMHPQIQPMASDLINVFQKMMQSSDSLFITYPKTASSRSTRHTFAYRYCLYEMRDTFRKTCAYGILVKERQGEHWMTIANISPLSHDKRKVEHLANLYTEQKLDPIHLPDVVTDFLRDSTGTV